MTNTKPQAAPAAVTDPLELLPEGWDVERDLLVLVGPDRIGAARLFQDAGQVRILSYLLPGDPDPVGGTVKVARNAADVRAFLQGLGEGAPEHLSLRPMPGASLDTATLQRIGEELARALKAWRVARNTVDESGSLWLVQIAQNLAELATHPSVDELTGAFEGRPGFIVSPGPSLDRNIAALQGKPDDAVLITCPHALHALDKVGIVPDIVVVGDARGLEWQYGDYDFSRVPALVLMSSSAPELFSLPAQRVFTYGFHPEIDMWAYGYLGKNALLPSGGSVACTELSLALRMGCSSIAFLGQDLAFEGQRVYSSEARDGDSIANISEDGESFVLERNLPVDEHNRWGAAKVPVAPHKVVEVPGYYGGTVKTWPAFAIFIDWFANTLASLEAGPRVFNCTEGGAFLRGMEHVSLSEHLSGLESVAGEDPRRVLEQRASRWDRVEAVAAMRAGLARTLAQLEDCRGAARGCLKALKGARANPNKLERLGKEEARLNREVKRLPFLAVAAQKEIRSATEAGARATTVEANLEASERLFRVVLNAANAAFEPLSESYRRLGKGN